jgi:ADP-dependent phosphofructokinase/glucokinase
MKSQDSKQKTQYLDKLLTTYNKSIESDEIDIKKHKEDFINQIKKIDRKEISNTVEIKPKGISIWKRLKKTLGIG